ncbi:UNVERIFIED_CONTAM: hypothetical protein O8I53_08500 [Campylobacter lari]
MNKKNTMQKSFQDLIINNQNVNNFVILYRIISYESIGIKDLNKELKKHDKDDLCLKGYKLAVCKEGYTVLLKEEPVSLFKISSPKVNNLNDLDNQSKQDLLSFLNTNKPEICFNLFFCYDKAKNEVIMARMVFLDDIKKAIEFAIFENQEFIFDCKNNKIIYKDKYKEYL